MLHLVLAALAISARVRVDEIVTRVMRSEHIPGLSLAIARNGTPLYVRGYGERDVGAHLPADGYTVYAIGSLTKQFTAALVMQEVERGNIALQAPVRRYLPQIADTFGTVRIVQLLGQTSGVPSYTDLPRDTMQRLAASNPGPAALWRLVADRSPAFAPGTQWQYSNSNYLLLGMVLERVTGVEYSTLLDERIIEPLQLTSTAYGVSPFARNVAQGYNWNEKPAAMPMNQGVVDVAFSAGGIASNAPDLLRWFEALRSGRVVALADFTAMITSVRLAGGVPAQYGFGFFIDDWYGHRVIDHSGYIDGFSSADALVLDDGLELVLLCNGDRIDLRPLGKSIVALLVPARNANLSATLSQPAENENAQITADVRAIAGTQAFAALGTVLSVEFIERSVKQQITYDKYRVTFASGPWWVTIGYLADGTIASLVFAPDAG